LQEKIPVAKHMLWNEVNHLLFETEIQLMSRVLNNLAEIEPVPQSSAVEPTYYKKRTPNDSQLSAEKTIEQQFDLMRICDPERYPAWFEMHGQRYKITLEKFQDE
jgi:methionyl-tRNA formyltransferase